MLPKMTGSSLAWAAMGAIDNYRKQFAGDSYGNFIGDYVVFGYGSNEFGRTLTQRTNPVGSKLPNELGLFDLSGNAAEFVWDGYGAYPEGALTDYRGAGTISNRIIRGGSWINDSFDCTVFTRGYSWPNWVNRHYGIRVVLQ